MCLSSSKVRYCVRTRVHTFDCSQHPFFHACGAGAVACVGTEVPAVYPPSPTSRCEGEFLVVEVMGYRGRVSCTALGFGSCSEAQARCRP